MASKTQRVKQRSLYAVETILRARLLQKVNILHQRTVVLLLRRTLIKNLEKREIKSETFATWKYCKYSRIVRPKKLKKEQSRLAFFTALDPTEYSGMIREWVYLFLQTVR